MFFLIRAGTHIAGYYKNVVPVDVRVVLRSIRSSPRTCPIDRLRYPWPVVCLSPVLWQEIVWWSAQRVSAIGVVSIRCSSNPPLLPPRRPRPLDSPVSPCYRRCPPERTTSLMDPGYFEISASPGCFRNRSSGCCSRSRAASTECNLWSRESWRRCWEQEPGSKVASYFSRSKLLPTSTYFVTTYLKFRLC